MRVRDGLSGLAVDGFLCWFFYVHLSRYLVTVSSVLQVPCSFWQLYIIAWVLVERDGQRCQRSAFLFGILEGKFVFSALS